MFGFAGLVSKKHSPSARDTLPQLLTPAAASGELTWQFLASLDGKAAIAFQPSAHATPPSYHFSAPQDGFEFLLIGELFQEGFSGASTPASFWKNIHPDQPETLAALNGSYLLIGFNPSSSQLFFFSYRLASQPLYFLQTPDWLAVATEMRYLLKTPGYKPTINLQGVASFLSCGFGLEGETLAEGICLLGPGQYLKAHPELVQLGSYHEFRFAAERDQRQIPELVEDLSRLILQAVQRRLHGDINAAVLLSGGYDSRTLLGCVQKLRPHSPLSTVTWGEERDDSESDAAIAAALAAQFNTRHTFYPLRAEALPDHFREFVIQGEGRTDAVGNYPEALRIFQRIREELQINCILRGDEFFGWKKNVHTSWEALHSMDIHALGMLGKHYSFIKPNWREELVERSSAQLRRILQNCPYSEVHDQKDYLYFTQRFWGYLNPLSQLKQRVIGVVNPFLDADILDFMSRVPTALRLDKALFRATARKMFPEMNWQNMATHHNLIDWDRRLSFDPRLQNYIRQILLETNTAFDAFWDKSRLSAFLEGAFKAKPPGLKTGWQKLRRTLQPGYHAFRLSASTEIFRLMILKIWVEEFLGGNVN